MSRLDDDRSSSETPVVHVAAVALRGDDLLMVRRGHGAAAGEWSLPDGPVRRGETMAEAVVRVVSTETAYVDGVCGPFIGWHEVIDDDAVDEHRVVMCFTAVIMDQDRDPQLEAAGTEIRWIPVWTVPELPLAEGLAEFLADEEIIDTVV
jgi:8-oxo-dGTP diphosphatase